MRQSILFFLCFSFCSLNSQVNSLVYNFSFNSCNGTESFGKEPAILFGFGNNCECGVDGEALNFSTPGQSGSFPRSAANVLSQDYTFSFYMFPQSTVTGSEAVDIWSIGNECNSDSIFQVRYFPIDGEIRVKLSDRPLNEAELSGFLTHDFCWSYIGITLEDRTFSLYIDNELVSQQVFNVVPTLTSTSQLLLSRGPCETLPFIRPYEGFIDELRIYNFALSPSDIIRENYFPNQIIEDEIVIYKGEPQFLETGGICSDNFQWSPLEGISDGNLVEPLASPDESTVYTLTVEDRNCQSVDQINVVFVDLDALDCSDLLLPSAFTPNGDGINDLYGISNSFIVDELVSFEIFDKWGGRMFYATEEIPNWNGIFRNEFVMPGPYIYRVRYICQGEESQRNGVVNVIR